MRALICLFSLMILTSCGYSLQGSSTPLVEKEGIRRVYIKPFQNDSFKAGVENVVYNALLKTISAGKRVVIVSREEEADAILFGTVSGAGYSSVGSIGANALQPTGLNVSDTIQVATTYSANLSCNFSLNRRIHSPNKKDVIWGASFSRSKFFAGSNQLDVLGTTAPLINESDFDRAVTDMAQSMMGDVHESMLAMF